LNRVIAFLFFMLFLAAIAFIMLRNLQTRDDRTNFSIVGGEWRLDDKRLTFRPDGKIGGFAGCNRFFGNFVATDATLDIGPLGSTRKACPAPLMERERDFLHALENASRYAIADRQLSLQDTAGNGITLSLGDTSEDPLPAGSSDR
jgi:heat shock protein HslJ